MLPQTNATLTAVTGAGGSEDYDTAATTGAVKWEGRATAYFSERRARVEDGDSTSIVVTRSLVVAASLPVEWAQGDTLTFTYRGTATSGQVRAIERHEVPGVALATVRLTLEDQ